MEYIDSHTDPQFPMIDAGLQFTRRPDVKPGHFYWQDDAFCNVGVVQRSIDFRKATAAMDSALKESLKREMIAFAEAANYAETTIYTVFFGLATALKRHPTSGFDVAWMANALKVEGFLSAHYALYSFFETWRKNNESAVSEQALHLLFQTKKEQGGRNVLSDDPEKSWHTEEEFDALRRAVWKAYDNGDSCTQVTLVKLLSMTYARRPVQMAHLKIADIRTSGPAGEIPHVYFPGVKDRGAENNFRDSKFEIHPMSDELYGLFQIHVQEAKSLFEEKLGKPLSEAQLALLPVFCTAYQIDKASQVIQGYYGLQVEENLAHPAFHLRPQVIAKIVSWSQNGPRLTYTGNGTYGREEEFNRTLAKPLSHRTGKPMATTATRMRHTLARRLARKGVPKHILSAWLGHTDSRSLDSYYDDPAEKARELDEAMKPGLVPLAMAFAGKLIDSDDQATRAGDPDSDLEFAKDGNLKKVGACGKHSFCGITTVPLPCYRCNRFEPLVFAPHQEVLDALLDRQAEEQRLIKIGSRRNLLQTVDLSEDVRAVRAVIARCEARKAELGSK